MNEISEENISIYTIKSPTSSHFMAGLITSTHPLQRIAIVITEMLA